VGALGGLVWRDWRETAGKRIAQVQRGVSCFVVAVALFPVISASDDRLALAHFDASVPSAPVSCWSAPSHGNTVAPPLDDPEHGRVSAPLSFCRGPLSLFLVAPPTPHGLIKCFTCRSIGRAPPSFPVQG
jgi:hypothetical protein